MLKRTIDILFSLFGLIIALPLLIVCLLAIWLYDFNNPFYIVKRVGKNGKVFHMIKLRSMKIDADKSGVASTANNDNRITPIGKLIRKYKIDELSQLINVLFGSMSLVGPRPQLEKEVKFYTEEEKGLLKIQPGITDFASIIFSDEGSILQGSQDPDLDYNQLIRPWKSRLGIFYIKNVTISLDMKLIVLTAISLFSKQRSLKYINKILISLSADEKLIEVSKRENQLIPHPPPGSDFIVTSRE